MLSFFQRPPSVEFQVDGNTVSLSLPKARNTKIPSLFLLGLPKAGSTLMNNIMEPLLRSAGLTNFAITQKLREMGVSPQNYPSESQGLFVPQGYAYVGFRGYRFPFGLPEFASGRTIVLVRDPRDMLVSLYFSVAESHPEPGAAASEELLNQFRKNREAAQIQDIASFVKKRAQSVRSNFDVLAQRLAGIEHKVWRYEDIIFDKLRWTEEMLDYLGIQVPAAKLQEVVAKNDIVPSTESTGQHIRKVTPGDHRDKLDQATIDTLNNAFEGVLRTYDYA